MKGTRRDRECWQASDPGKSCDPAGEKPGEEVPDPLSSYLLPGSLSISLPLPLSGSLVGKQGHLACCSNSQGPSLRAEDRVEKGRETIWRGWNMSGTKNRNLSTGFC